jgi:hypothetical protein
MGVMLKSGPVNVEAVLSGNQPVCDMICILLVSIHLITCIPERIFYLSCYIVDAAIVFPTCCLARV